MPEATIFLIFTTSFVIALSGAMMPGPLLAITISEAARRGFWAGPKLILGHGILELALIAALAAGLSKFMENELVPAIIGLVGGTILIGMGLITVRRGRQPVTIPTASSSGMTRSRTLVLTGVLVSIANPYWLIWWVTFGTFYLVWSLSLGTAGIASFFTGHISADFIWYLFIGFLISTGRRFFNQKIYNGILIACSIFLFYLAVRFIVDAMVL